MENLNCPKCNQLLNTDDIWCYSTVDPKNIIIGISCFDCKWYAAQLISSDKFIEFENNLFCSTDGVETIVSQLNNQKRD